MIKDTVKMINQYIKDGKRILAEGANGASLDIDHGSYPFVTSSNTTVGAVCTGLGVPPKRIETIVAAVKAYTTRSGQGPMPTELLDKLGDKIQEKGSEWGVTTGRRRRVGWLDLNILKRGVMINGYSSLMVTKLGILSRLSKLSTDCSLSNPMSTLSIFFFPLLHLVTNYSCGEIPVDGASIISTRPNKTTED